MSLLWSSMSHNPPSASQVVGRVGKNSCHVFVLKSSVTDKYLTWSGLKNGSQM